MAGLHRPEVVARCFPSGELSEGAHPKTRALLAFLRGYDAQASVHGIVFTQTRQVRRGEGGVAACGAAELQPPCQPPQLGSRWLA
jgi:hypothetical protein